MATATVSTPEPAARANSFGRIFGALFSPKATFQSIVARPTWLAPLVVLCLLHVAVTMVFTQRVGWRNFMEKKLESNARVQQLPPEQQQRALEQATKFAPAMGYARAVIGPFGGAVVVAAIYMAVFNLLCGANIEFKTSLAIAAYAWVPWIVYCLLGILIIFLKDPSTVDLENLVGSNAGAFLSEDSPKWLLALLGSLDLFSFWTMALLAAGYSAVNPKKISYGTALAWVVVVWLGFVLLKTGVAAAFS